MGGITSRGTPADAPMPGTLHHQLPRLMPHMGIAPRPVGPR
jgi:hypothetical protein